MAETAQQRLTRLHLKAQTDVNEAENALGRALYALDRKDVAKAKVDVNWAENEMGQALYALKQLGPLLTAGKELPIVSIEDAACLEEDKQLIFTLLRTGDLSEPSLISFQTNEGSATSADFHAGSGNIAFLPGQSVTSILVEVIDDELVEGAEQMGVAITGAYGAVVGRALATGTITSGDVAPQLPAPPVEEPASSLSDVFLNVPIGGGGFVTDIGQSPDGIWQHSTTDTSSGYFRKTGELNWRLALTEKTMPQIPALTEEQNKLQLTDGGGSYTSAIGNDGTAYCEKGGFLIRSKDAFTDARAEVVLGPLRMAANLGGSRTYPGKIALDPTNPMTFLLGARGAGEYGGAWASINGSEPKHVTSIPYPDDYEGNTSSILVDVNPNNPKQWLAAVMGVGVLLSENGPMGPFTLIQGTGKLVIEAKFDDHHRIWMVAPAPEYRGTPNQVTCYNLLGKKFVDMTMKMETAVDIKTVAVDPFNPDFVFAMNPNGGTIRRVLMPDGQFAWHHFEHAGWPFNQHYSSPRTPWRDRPVGETGLFPSRIVFDRKVKGRIHCAHGTGTAYTDIPHNRPVTEAKDAVVWRDTSEGNEQICTNGGMSLPNGDFELFGWDKGFWKFNGPTFEVPQEHYPEFSSFTHCWDGDYSPGGKVRFYLCNSSQRGHETCYSVDGTPAVKCENQLPEGYKYGGSIAAISDDEFIQIPANNGRAYYSKDRGKTALKLIDLGVPMPPEGHESGWIWAWYFNRIHAVASKAKPGRVWMFNYGPTGYEHLAGIWMSEKGAAGPWAQVYTGKMVDTDGGRWDWLWYHHMRVREVPGTDGNTVMIVGGPGHDEPILITRDGCKTWSKLVPTSVGQWDAGAEAHGIRGVYDFDFGAPEKPGQPYVLRFYGTFEGQKGIWEIRDWQNPKPVFISKYAHGMVTSEIRTVTGDRSVFGKWAYGMGGEGWRGSLRA